MSAADVPTLNINNRLEADMTESLPVAESIVALPPQAISEEVLLEKYAKGDETCAADIYRRVAHALAEAEAPENRAHWAQQFLQALHAGFVPAGRIQSAAGTSLSATLINCFVQPVGDSITQRDDGHPGIYTALAEAAETMRRGGGVGYDFSRIRPRGAAVGSTQSLASGPVSYMRVFDRSCETVESAGARRGAQMGVLRCDHPDIEEFIHAKDSGDLSNFNISVAITDLFMRAVVNDEEVLLLHAAKPGSAQIAAGAYQLNTEGGELWVYRSLPARMLWEQIMRATYDHAEPGVLFLDRINSDNNLSYCETIASTNPCAEQPLPPYGCCCLGSINLVRFVQHPFTESAYFDEAGFAALVHISIRMLDDVLDVTVWPLPQQQQEAANKRRVGLGFTALGDALIMLNLRYDTAEARAMAARIAEIMRDQAYAASVELAKERGAFPLFNADLYLSAPTFASRLPADLKAAIRKHGMRNSHLLSIAPTGTISLAFADNASNGIEPAFSWRYLRKKRMPDGTTKEYAVEDHAWRLFHHLRDVRIAHPNSSRQEPLPSAFITALEMSAQAHESMVAAVAPYIDTSISKTVNVPADYPYTEFQDLYLDAWRSGLKGLATYRPNAILGSVLSAAPSPVLSSVISMNKTLPETATVGHSLPDSTITAGLNQRLAVTRLTAPVLASLRWPGRPDLPSGNPAWTYMIRHPFGEFALFVGELANEAGGKVRPFEVWVNGAEQPRGLGALAKTLSMDMRTNDAAWLLLKLDALATVAEERAFEMPMPPHGQLRLFPGIVAATAAVIRWRCEMLKALPETNAANLSAPTPVLDAMFSHEEPETGPSGTLAWTVDIDNPIAGERFSLTLKEVTLPDGEGGVTTRPCALGLSGNYPRALDGLARLLSLDMRVIDPAWIGMKLRKLLNYAEPLGQFMAFVPGLTHGERRQQLWPSTVAYMARLIIHRYAMLNILDEAGLPVRDMGVLQSALETSYETGVTLVLPGQKCPECGNLTMIHRDGCDFCTACGYVGQCG